jgi:hypothetical protein
MSDWPPTTLKFLPGTPFDPPRAKIPATIVVSGTSTYSAMSMDLPDAADSSIASIVLSM